eukprot:s710_g22.t1
MLFLAFDCGSEVALLVLEAGCNLDFKGVCRLIRAEGPAAVDCLDKYPKEAGWDDPELGACTMARAHTWDQLWVILGKGTQQFHCLESYFFLEGSEQYNAYAPRIYSHSEKCKPVPPSLWIILCFHIKKPLEELMQYLITFHYHRDRFQLLEFDLADIVAGWMAIVRQALDSTKLEKPWMSIFSAMSWLRALYSLRGETWMGPRLLPIISALKDTLTFFLVTLTCTLAATHAY